MATRDLTDMTWEEVRDGAGPRAVALLPVGAVEAHGPHLPLGTDLIIADAWTREAAARLEERGCTVFRLPALAYTPAPFARAFPGTISGSADWVTGAVLEIAATLGRQGVAVVGLASAHLDPANLTALRQAVKRAGETPGCAAVVFPDLTSRPWALWLGEEFKTGACHAGRFETSIVMAVRPELVNEQVRHQLPAVPASLSQAIRAGKQTFEEAGGSRAYFGWPAEATALEGRAHLDTLARLLADEVHAALEPEPAR